MRIESIPLLIKNVESEVSVLRKHEATLFYKEYYKNQNFNNLGHRNEMETTVKVINNNQNNNQNNLNNEESKKSTVAQESWRDRNNKP